MAKPTAPRTGTLNAHLLTSKLLGGRRPMFLYTPPRYEADRRRYPLLLLLHGMWGCQQDWVFDGHIPATMDRLIAAGEVPPMIVAMPSDGLHDDGTFYVNWHDGSGRFEDYFLQEVLVEVDRKFRTSRSRKRRAIAGLSMGGFGAMHLGLRHPEQFSIIAGLSSLLRPPQAIEAGSHAHRAFGPGKSPQSAQHRMVDPFELVKDRRLTGETRIYLNCGTEDHLLRQNRAFHEHLTHLGVEHAYEEFPGHHDWPYWRTHVVDALRFIAKHLA
jgi:S-formylglutathione hydrolase FrmB